METLGLLRPKDLPILWVSLLPSPPVQPCWALYSPPWLGARAQGEVISWWERRGWSGWRHELVQPVTLHLWPALQQAGGWLGCSGSSGTAQPTPTLGLRLGTPRQWDNTVGRELIGFVRISLPKLAPSQTHPAPGKRALLTSPGPALRTSGHPPRRKGTARPLVSSPAHPGAHGSVLSPGGGRAQPSHHQPLQLAPPPPPPGQVRGPGDAWLAMGPRP